MAKTQKDSNNTDPTLARKKRLHIVMQGKGGCGKTFCAARLCERHINANIPFRALDIDPVNNSLEAMRGLEAQAWDLLTVDDNGEVTETEEIQTKRISELMVDITKSDCDVILDAGASTYLPLNNFIIKQKLASRIAKQGFDVYLHCILIGDENLGFCLEGFKSICESHDMDHTKLIVWKNEQWGKIAANGKAFEEMKVFKDNVHHVEGIITAPKQRDDLYADALKKTRKMRLSITEAIKSEDFDWFEKERLEEISDYYDQAIAAVL